jgi:putative ABC transport system permease protein
MNRFYRLLLHLYPSSFRAEYGEEITEIFRDRESKATGLLGPVGLLLSATADVVANAAAVHWEILLSDLRYTARTLGRARGFTLTAVLVVALGVGANAAAFSVADFVLIRPLPFPDPDRLVRLWESTPGYPVMELAPANYRDWKTMSRSFAGMGAYTPNAVNLAGAGEPQRIEGVLATRDLLPVVGVSPWVGRLFSTSDSAGTDRRTVILSYGLWQREFGGENSALGRVVTLDDTPYEVIGVMPPDFHFPSRDVEYWLPLELTDRALQSRTDNYLNVVARLRSDVTLEQVRADLTVIAARLEAEYPRENAQTGSTIYRLREEVSERSRILLLALCGAAMCILVLACANLANLLLARTSTRERELAVRAALGAGRERLVRQMMTESIVLALMGGILGVLVAIAAVPLLARLVPNTLPIAEQPGIDLRVLSLAGLFTGFTGIGFGVWPALRLGGRTGFSALRAGAQGGGGERRRLRSLLVTVEVTASVVLIVAAGLLIRAMYRLQQTDPGFRVAEVQTLRTALPFPRYSLVTRRIEFYRQVLSEVRSLPGVSHAAYISFLPIVMQGGVWPVAVGGEEIPRTGDNTASLRYVTPDYFGTMDIPVLQGRDVAEDDTQDRLPVAVVSQSFARRHWPAQDPIGKRFNLAFLERTVVGVVKDVKVRGIERTSEPQVYLPYQQVGDSALIFYAPKDLVIRSSSPGQLLIPAVRRIVAQADPIQPISNLRSMSEVVAGETASRRAQLRVLGALAVIALMLAGVGIHGLLAYTVSQRTREIGVRRALGASPAGIARIVVGEGLLLALAGIVLGVLAGYAAGKGMNALLFGVQPSDPATMVAAITLSVVMTLAGAILPTIRAVRVSPMLAMRSD